MLLLILLVVYTVWDILFKCPIGSVDQYRRRDVYIENLMQHSRLMTSDLMYRVRDQYPPVLDSLHDCFTSNHMSLIPIHISVLSNPLVWRVSYLLKI